MTENLKEHIDKFISTKELDLSRLDEFFERKVVNKKQLLLKEGALCRDLFFVNAGCLQIFYLKENGVEQTIDFALENWWMTDFSAFSQQTSSKFSIRTVEKSEVLVLTHSAREKLLKEIPELERYFHLVFQRAFAASQYRMKLLYEYSREELYHHFKNNFPDFVQRVPQYLIASFLGLTPEYLSEIKKRNIS